MPDTKSDPAPYSKLHTGDPLEKSFRTLNPRLELQKPQASLEQDGSGPASSLAMQDAAHEEDKDLGFDETDGTQDQESLDRSLKKSTPPASGSAQGSVCARE